MSVELIYHPVGAKGHESPFACKVREVLAHKAELCLACPSLAVDYLNDWLREAFPPGLGQEPARLGVFGGWLVAGTAGEDGLRPPTARRGLRAGKGPMKRTTEEDSGL